MSAENRATRRAKGTGEGPSAPSSRDSVSQNKPGTRALAEGIATYAPFLLRWTLYSRAVAGGCPSVRKSPKHVALMSGDGCVSVCFWSLPGIPICSNCPSQSPVGPCTLQEGWPGGKGPCQGLHNALSSLSPVCLLPRTGQGRGTEKRAEWAGDVLTAQGAEIPYQTT